MNKYWVLYKKQLEDVSILIDKDAARHIPAGNFSYVLTVLINTYHVVETKEEENKANADIDSLQRMLEEELERDQRGVFVARITSQHRLEFVCYVHDINGYRQLIDNLLQGMTPFRYTVHVKDEPEWDTYHSLLPSPTELQQSYNKQALYEIHEEGYRVGVRQLIYFYLHFENKSVLDRSRERVAGEGFRVENIDYRPSEVMMPHLLVVSKMKDLQEKEINRETDYLVGVVAAHQGKLNGWGIRPKKRAATVFKMMTRHFRIALMFTGFIILCSALGVYLFDGRPSRVERWLGTGSQSQVSTASPLKAGDSLPKVRLLSSGGELVPITDQGRPMVLNFCDVILEPCREDYRKMQEVAGKYKDQYNFYTVRLEHSETDLTRELPSIYPVLYGEKGKEIDTYRSFHALPFPMTYVVNAQGQVILALDPGASIDADTLERISNLK